MRRRIAIIDGYNVIHKVADFRKQLDKSLAAARQGLVGYCSSWMAARGDFDEFWVVFDGDSSVMPWSREGGPGVRVIFTRSREDADDRILSVLREAGGGDDFVVVSSDNYVCGNARSHGARVISVADFFKSRQQTKRTGSGGRNREHGHDELSPAQQRQINESLKKEWGLE